MLPRHGMSGQCHHSRCFTLSDPYDGCDGVYHDALSCGVVEMVGSWSRHRMTSFVSFVLLEGRQRSFCASSSS